MRQGRALNPDPGRRSLLLLLVCFGVLSVYFTGFFPAYTSPNEVSRLETVYAAVELGTFRIDDALPVLGDHQDKSSFQSHFYSNKAPGLALAAIPVYRGLRVFFPPPRSASAAVFVILRILVVSLVCMVALARFGRWALSAHGSSAPLVVAAVAFGTPFLYYSRSFFSHAWAAALLFLSWDLVRRGEDVPREAPRPFWLGFGAGFLASWAVISEYSAAIVAGFLFLRAFSPLPPRRGAGFVAGALPPLMLLAAYNAICFGSPWSLSSAHEAHPEFAALARQGMFGFGPPSLAVMSKFLLDPARGLLLCSPFWIWAIPGFVLWWKSCRERLDCLLSVTVVFAGFLILSGYPNWYGGWCLGNRYLLPLLFFGGLSLGSALRSSLSRDLFAAATIYSVLSHFLLTATWSYLPPDLPWPALNASLWFLQRGWVAPNLLGQFGTASLLPPALVTAVVVGLLLASCRSVVRAAAATIAGACIAFLLWASSSPPAYGPRLWRAAIFGAYSGLDPARRELDRVGLAGLSSEQRKEAIEAWRFR